MKRLNATRVISVLFCIGVGMAERDGRAQDAATSQAQEGAKAQLEEQQKAAAQTVQTYRARNPPNRLN